jgi:signal transduction histidine kinase/ligand-binding sensor domain-containing protein/DNA-binding response OmpR family regulator
MRKRRIAPVRLLLLLWGLFFSVSSLPALDPQKALTQYKMDTWQIERGLEQRAVVSICQTRDGYLWLGALNKLIRFDGNSFKTINKKNIKQSRDDFLWVLLEDRDSRLWAGGGGGLSVFKDGKLKPFILEKSPGVKEIFAILEDREGGLWIGTANDGLIHLNNGMETYYSKKDRLAGDKVRALVEDDEGRLWIGTSTGLSYHDPAKPGTFTTYRGAGGPFEKNIYCMLYSKNGNLWIGCTDGLYRLHGDRFVHIGKHLPNPAINCLYEDSDLNLWAGTDGSGLVRIKDGEPEIFPPGHRMAALHIYAIFEDVEKNLWLGSANEGLHRLRDTLFTPYTTWEGMAHNVVRSVFEDLDGGFLIGTAQGVHQLKDGKLTLKWTQKQGLLSNNIFDILIDYSGAVWIGTDIGLNRYRNGRFEIMDHRNAFRNNKIVRLGKDKRGAVWILTQTKLWRFYKKKFDPMIDIQGTSRGLYIDSSDNVWVATSQNGLYKWRERNYTHITTKNDLVNNEVESFYEDNLGVIYVCTRGGLSMIKGDKIYNITTQNGLLDSFIREMAQDNLGYFWLAGRTGFSRIDKKQMWDFTKDKNKEIHPVLFNESEGIKYPYCYQCIKSRDGKLWFATKKGLLVIDPDDIGKKSTQPRVAIEGVSVNGKLYYTGDRLPGSSLNNPLVLPPGTERVEFYYTGISFTKSNQVRFICKLDGFDKHWVGRDNIRNTSYTDLDPGRYIFRVKAGTGNTYPSDEVTIHILSEPHFSQTPGFYILVISSGILFTFLIYRFRVRALKNRQKDLTIQVELRTSEINDQKLQLEEQSKKLKELDQVKSRFFANISHEFRTPLTLLLGPLEQMIDNCTEEERKRKLTLMRRNAQRLLRLINQLLELSKLDSGKMKLQTGKTCMNSFVHGLVDSFQFMAQQKELELVFLSEHENEELMLFVDPRKMEDVMTNLLINAFKFTPAGGKIEVEIKQHTPADEHFPWGYVEISVSDTGPGIPPDQLANVFDRFYQADSTYEYHQKGSGIGLALCKELVELHNGVIGVNSPEGRGSVFYFRLPLDPAPSPSDARAAADTDTAAHEHLTMEMAFEEEENGKDVIDPETAADKREIILVVEDSADMRQYIKQALETDYMVVEAKDGIEGIETARTVIPDLVVSDVMMPGKDGIELCRTLKGDIQTSHIPIILLTAKASEENILEGLETGADDYVTKPFSTKILAARIKNLIDLRSQLQQDFKRELSLRPVKTSVSAIDREFLRDVQAVLKENISEPDFNVEEMCRKLYLSNTTLYRKIQALCGLTPTEFIRSYRLKRAAQLLKDGFGSVTEVAFEVGFSSRAYFTKCFKEKFHMLPSEIRGEH